MPFESLYPETLRHSPVSGVCDTPLILVPSEQAHEQPEMSVFVLALHARASDASVEPTLVCRVMLRRSDCSSHVSITVI